MTTKHSWYLQLSGEVLQALYGHYGPFIQTMIEEADYEGQDVNMAQAAYSADPEPLTADFFLERTPYMAKSQALNQLANSTANGVLEEVSENKYKLTEKGREIAIETPRKLVEFAKTLSTIPDEDGERLLTLLRRLVDASLSAAEPAQKPAITRSRLFDPGPNAPMLEYVRRYINDLAAFRDDVHIAAWQNYGVEGNEWEAFSLVWGESVRGDNVSTATEVAEKLNFRGYNEADYEKALRTSVNRGWLTRNNGAFDVTDEGAKLRQEAESTTDTLFYAPWTVLDEAELNQLQKLMTQLRDTLKGEE